MLEKKETQNTWKVDNFNTLLEVAKVVLEKATTLSKEKNKSIVVALQGDLGSGKTTFTKQIAKILGITENVTSPTFVIQKRFKIENHHFRELIHIDTYRIDLADELVRLGWHQDLVENNNLIVVEWPENISDILPPETITLKFTFVDEVTREVSLIEN